MKKVILYLLVIFSLFTSNAYAAKKVTATPTAKPIKHNYVKMWNGKKFDMYYFKSRKNIYNSKKKMWKITIDDMEDKGKIEPTIEKDNSHVLGTGNNAKICDIYPEIILSDYKAEKFIPIFNIEIDYGGKNWYFFKSAIIKIGSKTYKFYNINTDTNVLGGYVFETLDLFVDANHSDFIDNWVKEKGKIKIRLKGAKGNIDFYFNANMQKTIKYMLKDYKSAGGRTNYYTIDKQYGDYTITLKD